MNRFLAIGMQINRGMILAACLSFCSTGTAMAKKPNVPEGDTLKARQDVKAADAVKSSKSAVKALKDIRKRNTVRVTAGPGRNE